jgi:hypothetical protein
MEERELDQALANEPKIISNTFATVYSNWGVTILLCALVLMGVISLSNENLIGIILLAIGIGGLTFNYGTDIDINNNRYRDFTRVYFIKFGQWKSLNLYPFITLLKTNKGRSAFGMMPVGGGFMSGMSAEYSDGEFGICLLNKTHYQKIEIEIMDDLKKAHERLEYFSRAMKKEIVTYKPLRISTTR